MNKKAQIGTGLTWVFATIIIFGLMLFFIGGCFVLLKFGGVGFGISNPNLKNTNFNLVASSIAFLEKPVGDVKVVDVIEDYQKYFYYFYYYQDVETDKSRAFYQEFYFEYEKELERMFADFFGLSEHCTYSNSGEKILVSYDAIPFNLEINLLKPNFVFYYVALNSFNFNNPLPPISFNERWKVVGNSNKQLNIRGCDD
jgi:hypothetical protein